jgi:two-component system chemotaxis response regulator CheY
MGTKVSECAFAAWAEVILFSGRPKNKLHNTNGPSSGSLHGTNQNSMKKARILVVDDNKTVATLLVDILEQLSNFEVVSASGGAEALDLIFSQGFDLVITDVNMPDVSGTELVAKLKSAKVKTRVIFITGEYLDLHDTVEFVKLGVCDVLHKPFKNPIDLIASTRRALALEDPLSSLYASEPSSMLKQAISENLALTVKVKAQEKTIQSLKSEAGGASRKQFFTEIVLTRLLYLATVAGLTILFYRYGMIERGTLLYAFPAILFVLLSLPLDRIKGFIAKMKKAEGRATFK